MCPRQKTLEVQRWWVLKGVGSGLRLWERSRRAGPITPRCLKSWRVKTSRPELSAKLPSCGPSSAKWTRRGAVLATVEQLNEAGPLVAAHPVQSAHAQKPSSASVGQSPASAQHRPAKTSAPPVRRESVAIAVEARKTVRTADRSPAEGAMKGQDRSPGVITPPQSSCNSFARLQNPVHIESYAALVTWSPLKPNR